MSTVQKFVRWKLGNRNVCTASFGSGDPSRDVFYVRIRWSPKLGLQLLETFKSMAEARSMAKRIQDHGSINTEKWHNSFYPSRDWESATMGD